MQVSTKRFIAFAFFAFIAFLLFITTGSVMADAYHTNGLQIVLGIVIVLFAVGLLFSNIFSKWLD